MVFLSYVGFPSLPLISIKFEIRDPEMVYVKGIHIVSIMLWIIQCHICGAMRR